MKHTHFYTMAGLIFILLGGRGTYAGEEHIPEGRHAKTTSSAGDTRQNLFPGGLDPPISFAGGQCRCRKYNFKKKETVFAMTRNYPVF